MASDDIYLRKDVYEADQRALIAEIKLGNEAVLKELRLFREEVNDRFAKVDSRFDKLEAKVEVVSGRVDGLERRMNGFERQIDALDHRIDRIEGYVGTGIAFIAMLVTVVVFIEPISRFVRKIFKPEPTITLEQIEALIDSKLQARK